MDGSQGSVTEPGRQQLLRSASPLQGQGSFLMMLASSSLAKRLLEYFASFPTGLSGCLLLTCSLYALWPYTHCRRLLRSFGSLLTFRALDWLSLTRKSQALLTGIQGGLERLVSSCLCLSKHLPPVRALENYET